MLVIVSKGTATRRDRVTTGGVSKMDDDSRAMRVPDCVRGIGTTRSRCRDGNVSLYYDDRVAVTMTAINIGYMEHLAGKSLFAVRLNVCPYTQVSDIVAAMDPLLDPLASEIPFDEGDFCDGAP